MKICSVETDLVHADRERKNMTELLVLLQPVSGFKISCFYMYISSEPKHASQWHKKDDSQKKI